MDYDAAECAFRERLGYMLSTGSKGGCAMRATAGGKPKAAGKILPAVATALLVVGAVSIYWATTCPCDSIPGFVLRGDAHPEPVTDWHFANDVPLCQIQVTISWRPHSLNVNCMATPDGELFVSCSFGKRKYWCPRVGSEHPGRLRLDGAIYPVVLNRVMDPTTLDRAWTARVQKLQHPEVQKLQPSGSGPAPDAERPLSWWSFHLQSAPNA